MKDHIRIVAWVYIALGILGLLTALLTFGVLLGSGLISGDRDAIRILTVIAIFAGVLIMLVSVPGIIAGLGLLGFKPWARILGIVLALLNLPGFPIGTLLGIYTIWALLDSESSLLFGGSNP
jgi:hypothetical protein